MSNFWQRLVKPFFVLAPMADVTDAAFRRVIAKYGKPDVLWTEFVSADGLVHPEGRARLLKDLIYDESERPIVAQLFTSHPEKMAAATRLCAELDFDGIDINMGCPDRGIEKQGAGAALMRDPSLAREIMRAAKQGAGNLPISIKTRLGYNQDQLEKWLPELLAEEPAAVTIHARTRKEMSKVSARWGRVADAVKLRDKLKSKTLIIGNGDVVDLADASQKAMETGADGIMLGRAIFGNPWLFAGLRSAKAGIARKATEVFSTENLPGSYAVALRDGLSLQYRPSPLERHQPSSKEKLCVMLEHTRLFEKLLGGHKSFAIMKKHYKAYVVGWPGAAELREKLMQVKMAAEAEELIRGQK
ncbi:MAG: tRNA-dihydrouridine synthase [Patescibacteria group bacterium]|nr:tRNA-dihydrouridine synthase [Patescibacteria group bacterium]